MVYFFATLSGFLLAYTYYEKNQIVYKKFLKNKIIKIVLIFYPMFLITLIYQNYEPIEVISVLTFTQAFIPKYALSGAMVSWYLTFYMFSLLVFPIVINSFKEYKWVSIMLSLFLLLFVIYISNLLLLVNTNVPSADQYVINNFVYYSPFSLLPAFLIGISFAVLSKNYEPRYPTFFVIVNMFVIFYVYDYTKISMFYSPVFFGSFFYFYSTPNKVGNTLDNKIFNYLGELSFALYLVHVPIFVSLSKYGYMTNFTYTILTIFLALFMNLVFERYLYKTIYKIV